MRIQFCGADRTVTGSCHWLEINGLKIMLDVGMYQGPRDEADRLNHFLPADVKSADVILLSHGHLDHCGKLPVAFKAGYRGPIYCTPATAEVARIVLRDSAQIQEEDATYLNRRSRRPDEAPVDPLYRNSDVDPVLKAMRRVPYGQKTDLGKGVSFTFFDAGHILGSAYILLEWTETGAARRLLFTADVGRYDSPILRDPQPPPGAVDVILSESTYGGRSHGPMSDVEPAFLDAVKYCIARRSRLLIPSFAVGRTQTVLWYLQKFVHEKSIPPLPIFVDSPMGVEMTRVTSQFPQDYDQQTAALIGKQDLFGLAHITLAESVQQSKQINSQQGPCVIIASSPTCEFGRILHHLKESVERENDLVVFVGYIPPSTLGRRLQDGQKSVRIFDKYYDVRCQIRTIHGLSAHADGDELLRFLKPAIGPQTRAFVVHGEADQAEIFAARLLKSGVASATVPALESSFYLFSSEAPAATSRPAREED